MSSLSVEVQDHIAIVTLDRPPINAMVKETYLEFQSVFDGLADRTGVFGTRARSGRDQSAPVDRGGRLLPQNVLDRSKVWKPMDRVHLEPGLQ